METIVSVKVDIEIKTQNSAAQLGYKNLFDAAVYLITKLTHDERLKIIEQLKHEK